MGNPLDLTGQKFGRLTVVKKTDERRGGYNVVWKCICDCGNVHKATGKNLVNRNTKSCGCLKKEFCSKGGNAAHILTAENKAKAKIANGFIDGTCVNALKQKVRKDSTTGITGVRKYVICNVGMIHEKYRAYITFKGKLYNLGCYDYIEDARAAREKAEKMLFEPFLEWYNENFKNNSVKEEKL